MPLEPCRRPLYLALDTGSPLVSVAVGAPGFVAAEASVRQEQSSEALLGLVDAVLDESATRLQDLAGVCALCGPGSFTGLRVGLATVLGFHQALALPATALPTLEVLAAAALPCSRVRGRAASDELILAGVDALRGEWFVQPFRSHAAGLRPEVPPRIVRPAEVRKIAPSILVGFGLDALARQADLQESRLLEPPPLAAVATGMAGAPGRVWNPELLTRPLYLRPPAVGRPGRRSRHP